MSVLLQGSVAVSARWWNEAGAMVWSVAVATARHWRLLAGLGAAVGVAAFAWEHSARKRNVAARPSVYIRRCSEGSRRMFAAIGRLCATVSSFYARLDMRDLLVTAKEFVEPILTLLASPIAFFSGYRQVAKSYAYPFLVALGSVTLAGAAYWFAPTLVSWPFARAAQLISS
ncbi:Hypothetical protein UVM_LOCUS51 [uncultured virus]|nr:Hypothetical protein UVM_LOCUS51 [uncultured virus]